MKFPTISAWLDWLEKQHVKEIDLGLDRIRQVADNMQILPLKARVFTVAGTNGKGSFVAMLSALLQADGRRVASYTSPHIQHFNERICINQSTIDDAILLQAFDQVFNALSGISLSYFEFTTLAALWIFQQTPLDDIILEVGLGGRLDAVNIVDPDWAIISSVGIDHEEYLGSDIEHIAAEKAGILRQLTPLICAESADIKTLDVVASGREHYRIGSSFNCHRLPVDVSTDSRWCYVDESMGIEYTHLLDNGLSLPSMSAAIFLMNKLRHQPLDEHTVQTLIDNCRLPGRFQQFNLDGVKLIVDVAHNTQAASMLCDRIGTLEGRSDKKRIAIFNILQDKNAEQLIALMKGRINTWFIGELNHPRAYNSTELESLFYANGIHAINVSETISEALAQARLLCSPGDEIIAFGSFYVVADVLKEVEKH